MSISSVPSLGVHSHALGRGDSSWLSLIAKALAKAMGKLQHRMKADATLIDASGGKDNSAQTDLKVAAQEYALVVSSINTVLKTVGQANNALARKD